MRAGAGCGRLASSDQPRAAGRLHLVATLQLADTIETPLLPGFSVPIGQFFPA